MITRTVSDVSDVTLNYTDVGNTLSVGAGNAMSFVALVISSKGQPGKVLPVNDTNWQKTLGKPFHFRAGSHAESLRHISEAVVGGTGYVVRVMPDDARCPVLTIGAVSGDSNTVTASAAAYGAEPTLSDGSLAAIYLIDGDNELPRSIEIVAADAGEYGANFFILTLTELQASGDTLTLDTQVISFDVNAVDGDNKTAFIEDALSQNSTYMRAVADVSQTIEFKAIAKTAFTGGTSGTYSDITTAHYQKALDLIISENPSFEAVIAAGCYDDTILDGLTKLADSNNVSFYYDIEPNLSFAQAVTRQRDLAIGSHFAQAYHLPYSAIDPFYKSRANWGLSGFVFASKAKGVMSKSPTGGWHLTPAGETRATLSRKSAEINPNAGIPDYEAFVTVRLNKMGKNSAGQLMIDDALTCRTRKDALRFENQVSVDLAIGRAYVALANSLKHEPDGVTLKGLTSGMATICDGFVASECLVKPRDPNDGDSPYIIRVEQLESDLWKVSWDICISGSARRFIGQPRLLK
ncbi:hypothetical protein HWV00_21205 (plasmid) [Moritella sp. 24]|uniref:hypothetical protein n=1 Tax=Moritella sp. 24 TaxID=2746230 RepID=UPI001BA83C52|nr:hypothetical protein [Moritella sp. 24]QUM78794.1 hypothetical protein HWV00_21205 [Moritella sp. 24]